MNSPAPLVKFAVRQLLVRTGPLAFSGQCAVANSELTIILEERRFEMSGKLGKSANTVKGTGNAQSNMKKKKKGQSRSGLGFALGNYAFFKKPKHHGWRPLPMGRSDLERFRKEAQDGVQSVENNRILVFLPDSVQVFRFLRTGSLDALRAKYDVHFVIPDPGSKFSIKVDMDVESDHLHYLAVDVARYNAWEQLFQVSCRAMSSLSTSFQIRYRMEMLAKAKVPRTYWGMVDNARLKLRAIPGVFNKYREKEIKRLGPEGGMAKLIANVKPRFLLLTSSLYDCFTNDAIVTARSLGVPTMVLQTGWDNPSSKGCIAMEPDHFGVWGEQSKSHVRDMQRCSEDRLFVIGSPYYEPYFRGEQRTREEARDRLGLGREGKIVLLGGSFRQFDETALLRRIEAAIDAGELPPMVLFYRPHPGRQLREEENYFEIDWKYTMLDPEVEEVYRFNQEKKKASRDDYNLSRIADLLTAVDLTISPLSSITLESLIMGRPVLSICYNDGKNVWGPDATAEMEHFREISRVPAVQMCRSSDAFLEDFREALAMAEREESADLARQGARYFVDNGAKPYGESLVDAVETRVLRR